MKALAMLVIDLVNGADVGMIQRRSALGLALKAVEEACGYVAAYRS